MNNINTHNYYHKNEKKAAKIEKVKDIIMYGIKQEQEYLTNLLQIEPEKYLERENDHYYLTFCKKCLIPWIVHQHEGEDEYHQIVFNKKRTIIDEDLQVEARNIIEEKIMELKAYKEACEKLQAIHTNDKTREPKQEIAILSNDRNANQEELVRNCLLVGDLSRKSRSQKDAEKNAIEKVKRWENCKVCNKLCSSENALKQHIESTHEEPYSEILAREKESKAIDNIEEKKPKDDED